MGISKSDTAPGERSDELDVVIYCPRCGEYKGTKDRRYAQTTSLPCVLCASMEKSFSDVMNIGGGSDFPIRYSIEHIAPKYRNKRGILHILKERGYSEVGQTSIPVTEKGRVFQKNYNDIIGGQEKEFLELVKESTPKYLEITDESGVKHYLEYIPPTDQVRNKSGFSISNILLGRR